MLKLFVKDNTSGTIHEYGTTPHDAMILQEDGSLHYENMQNCCGTQYPEEGYSFCLEDGSIPKWNMKHGVEPYIDIAGEYYTKPKTNADRIRAMSDEELEVFLVNVDLDKAGSPFITEWGKWLKQPAEVENG